MVDRNKTDREIQFQSTTINDETYFMIKNHDHMPAFLMSIVSDGNHWMFISSNGGLTAGRKNANYALFPYYTDDKLTEFADITGSKTIYRIPKSNGTLLWEPFSDRSSKSFNITRSIYKNAIGNKVLFEEVNHDLELIHRYEWCSSNNYGFVRKSQLINQSNITQTIEVLDGIQNLMPYGIQADFQAIRSNLADAYKRSELIAESGLGIYALSAMIVDRAEPSEALKANIVWSHGMPNPTYLLSSSQVDRFRNRLEVSQEEDIKAMKGAYLITDTLTLKAKSSKDWYMVANVNQDVVDVVALNQRIQSDTHLMDEVLKDVEDGTENLLKLVGSADGFQKSAGSKNDARHYSNTLFNIMRGGIFDYNYVIELNDFSKYLKQANKEIFNQYAEWMKDLPALFTYQALKAKATDTENTDLIRLCTEYLPLKFSRRHGDPSRPWNKFSINTVSEIDGSKILDYEGNWRDIFQNWEALAYAYPDFIEGMIYKFLNASTFDGYNPYRVTKDGFDWEVIEEHDPWSYIGYWGDHQVIYLQKFLEFASDHFPEKLAEILHKDDFVYANVPYRIKPYQEILTNPKDTIEFDHSLDLKIREKRSKIGADGALLTGQNGAVIKANFIEKLLVMSLTKLSNFIPEAGIWMNTQRPEWNDANNALVGNGVSMVTLCYLRRFFDFLKDLLASSEGEVTVSEEMSKFYHAIAKTLDKYQTTLSEAISDGDRKLIMDELGQAGSEYRTQVYNNGLSGKNTKLSIKDIQAFSGLTLSYLDHSIKANKRSDNMYHAYNLIDVKQPQKAIISRLEEMLEGQVAVLSSGYLSASEALEVLNAMKQSKLFREDQYSYLLYPNKKLAGFMQRNNVSDSLVKSSPLLSSLIHEGNKAIIQKDVNGTYHFHGTFNNADSLKAALEDLPAKYDQQKSADKGRVLEVFEEVFNHKAFTGRSGTFYGYEGLGSIYWHMVSKLRLAVMECTLSAIDKKESDAVVGNLLAHYYEITEGIGVYKSPALYGAFPIDPYSHTPLTKGAQQPGMTGQVKEDILSRIGELGVSVDGGAIHFHPALLKQDEFLKETDTFTYIDVAGYSQDIELPVGSLSFTICQVPVIYQISSKAGIELSQGEETISIEGLVLNKNLSAKIFSRSGEIKHLIVKFPENILK